jgi:hypothetical protein
MICGYVYIYISLIVVREECRLRVLEIMSLRRIFGPKRDKVTRVEKIT